MNGLVSITTQKEFDYLFGKQPHNKIKFTGHEWDTYTKETIIEIKDNSFYSYGNRISDWCSPRPDFYTFNQWCILNKFIMENNKTEYMEAKMLDILNKTYDNPVLRRTTVPLFMSNPGIGKTTIIKEFAKDKGANLVKITLSQRMPNEVISMMMPNSKTGKLEVFDSLEISMLKPGDILFFDEVFNGTLKQTLDAVLNFTEDRVTPSGKHIEDIMIVAASNPQGLIHLTPQIKQRFIRYELKFNREEYQTLLKNQFGMPENISKHLCLLIEKEKFESDNWDFITPRSVEKAINQIGHGLNLDGEYENLILPILKQPIQAPCDWPQFNVKEGENIEFLTILQHLTKLKNNF
jgi:hypothetical protein